ncbi:MAG: hypothetical protein K2N35_13360 [Muribaculaceae bacterium]|nr:hypothetical protein [Muribaculaceae bacterium]
MSSSKDIFLYFGLKAEIEGNFALKEPIVTYSKGFHISIFSEDRVYKISLIKNIDNNEALKYKYDKDSNLLTFPEDKDMIEYIRLFQNIESIGGYNYGIKKIRYQDTLEIVWYEGSQSFQNLEPVLSAKRKFTAPRKKILSKNNFSSILLLDRLMPDAKIPYNFYREASNFYDKHEYRLAYLHYYMILEYCFIKGNNFSELTQISQYENNIDVVFAVLDTIKLYRDRDIAQFNWLTKTVKDRFNSFSLKNILKFLFRYRGEIAHGTKKAGQYLTDESELVNITSFIRLIALTICGNMQVYCEAFTKCKNSRLPQRIEELKKDLASVLDS